MDMFSPRHRCANGHIVIDQHILISIILDVMIPLTDGNYQWLFVETWD